MNPFPGSHAIRNSALVFTNIFVPDLRMFAYIRFHEAHAFIGVQIEDFYAGLAKPFNAPAEGSAFADYERANAELPDKPTAVPAGRQSRHHHYIAIRAQSTRAPKRIRFRMRRRVTLLHASIVTGADQLAPTAEHRSADGKAAFGQTAPGFANRDCQHRSPI
jgi:hypothetical protein